MLVLVDSLDLLLPLVLLRVSILCKEGLASHEKEAGYLPFLICYDGAQEYVLYGKSEQEIKIQLRKIYRPENFSKIYVKRLYPNQVIQFYFNKRKQALSNQ